jgi:hypothetical protein
MKNPREIAQSIAKQIQWETDIAQEVILALLTEVNLHKEKVAVERTLASFDEEEGTDIEFLVQLKLDTPQEKNKDLIWEMGTNLMRGVVRQIENDGLTPDNVEAYVEKVWITSGRLFSDVNNIGEDF